MDKHGDFVGGRREGKVSLPGMSKEEVEVMTATQGIAKVFPYVALGSDFERFWSERSVSWQKVVGLDVGAHL